MEIAMSLIRCQDQKSQSLEDFYTELSQQDDVAFRKSGKAMLELLGRLQDLPIEESLYGLTSHNRLCLLAEDEYSAACFIRISALDEQNYAIEYLMPERISPWPYAYVRGETDSLEKAIEMLLTGIKRSEGWI
jgi:hypothetical protein